MQLASLPKFTKQVIIIFIKNIVIIIFIKNIQTSFPYHYRVEILKNPKITDNVTLFKNLIGHS